jgi:hypothetical protein
MTTQGSEERTPLLHFEPGGPTVIVFAIVQLGLAAPIGIPPPFPTTDMDNS